MAGSPRTWSAHYGITASFPQRAVAFIAFDAVQQRR